MYKLKRVNGSALITRNDGHMWATTGTVEITFDGLGFKINMDAVSLFLEPKEIESINGNPVNIDNEALLVQMLDVFSGFAILQSAGAIKPFSSDMNWLVDKLNGNNENNPEQNLPIQSTDQPETIKTKRTKK